MTERKWFVPHLVGAQKAACMTEAMDSVRASVTGVNSLLTFERFDGLEDVVLEAADRATREAFGKDFLGYLPYNAPTRLVVMPARHDPRKIELTLNFAPRYRGKFLGGDLLADPADSNALRDRIDREVEKAVHARWPDAKVWLQHSGHRRHWELPGYYYSLILTVRVEPEFKGVRLAA